MKKELEYTQEEVSRNIDLINIDLDLLLRRRKSLNESIRSKKKQIKAWEDLDLRQTRLA